MDFKPELSWEFLPAEEIAEKSVRAVRNHVRHVKECSEYYRNALQRIEPDDITTSDDIRSLPLTSRNDLTGKASQFIGVDEADVVETVVTRGTTGRPIPIAFTKSDLDRIAYNQALSFHSLGMSAKDRVLLLLSLDRFSIDGMAHYHGTILAGANTMRFGTGSAIGTALQRYLQFFKPTILIAVPSMLRTLTLEMQENGFDAAGSTVRKIICTGESLRNRKMEITATGAFLESAWGADVFSSYGTTELSAAFGECEGRCGGHAHPELVHAEIVDEKGNAVPDGEPGELVATPLGIEGVPLLRYRTGDITFKIPGTCSCGRNSCRIGPILGRRSQLFTCNGTTVYPLVLTSAIDAIDEVKDYVVLLETGSNGADNVTIHAAVPPATLPAIAQAIKEATGVHIQTLVSNVPTIQSLRGGAKKKVPIVDTRGKVSLSS